MRSFGGTSVSEPVADALSTGTDEEADHTYVTLRLVTIVLWLAGGGVTAAYVALGPGMDTTTWLLLDAILAAAAVAWLMPKAQGSSWWFLPQNWAAVAIISFTAIKFDQIVILILCQTTMLYITLFFWNNRVIVVSHLAGGTAAYSWAILAVGGPIATAALVFALPMLLLTAIMMGALAANVRACRYYASLQYQSTVRALSTALDARDGYTGAHSEETLTLVMAVAARMQLSSEEMKTASEAALLHDIGKIGIPNEILHKAGPLTPEEWDLMREHPVIGERIVSAVEGMSEVARAIRHEHERWDGGGYPDGLTSEHIPIASRIILACDAYHAMTSDRPYRKALSVTVAISVLEANAGTQFDPKVVNELVSVASATANQQAATRDWLPSASGQYSVAPGSAPANYA